VQTAFDSSSAQTLLQNHGFECVILDLCLGKENGINLISKWQDQFPETEIIVLSGQTEIKTAVECLRRGASDYITKPLDPEELTSVVEKTFEKKGLKKSLAELEPLLRPGLQVPMGKSKNWNEIISLGKKLKHKTQLNILILGESGTGKEVFSRFLHDQEEDPSRPYVIANMPAIPANLLESELFGFEKGAFTDAKQSKPGKFELAHGGDIFLDEIGDLPLELQSKILRVLQEKQSQRLGSQKPHQLKFRALSATNQNLGAKIEKGDFREDLFYRLSDMVITLPPLRDRKSDIPLLAEYFIQKYSSQKNPLRFSERAIYQMMNYSWPGNIRQLESTIKRAIALESGELIDQLQFLDWSDLNSTSQAQNLSYDQQMRIFEKSLITKSLERNQGKSLLAMRELGLSRATFYRKLQDLGMPLR